MNKNSLFKPIYSSSNGKSNMFHVLIPTIEPIIPSHSKVQDIAQASAKLDWKSVPIHSHIMCQVQGSTEYKFGHDNQRNFKNMKTKAYNMFKDRGVPTYNWNQSYIGHKTNTFNHFPNVRNMPNKTLLLLGELSNKPLPFLGELVYKHFNWWKVSTDSPGGA